MAVRIVHCIAEEKNWLPGCPRPLASWSPHMCFEFEINVHQSSCLQVD